MAHLRFSFRSSDKFLQRICRFGVLLLVCLVVFVRGSVAQSDKQIASNDERTLTGRLHLISAYGPPGFGETPKIDSRVHYLVLYTRDEISLPCGPNDLPTDSTVCPTTKKLQLVFDLGADPRAQVKANRFAGKSVTVRGTLQHASTAAESTPIVIWVKSIVPAP
jgi:hypothetical protein